MRRPGQRGQIPAPAAASPHGTAGAIRLETGDRVARITFNRPVLASSFSLDDITLTRDGGADLLVGGAGASIVGAMISGSGSPRRRSASRRAPERRMKMTPTAMATKRTAIASSTAGTLADPLALWHLDQLPL